MKFPKKLEEALIVEYGPENVKENFFNLAVQLNTSPRSLEILKKYYGFEGEEMSLKQIGQYFSVTTERIKQIRDKAERVILRHLKRTESEKILQEKLKGIAELDNELLTQKLAVPIEEIEWSVRTYNALRNLGCYILGDVVAKTERDFLMTRNVGRKILNEVKEILALVGLKLAEGSTSPEKEIYESQQNSGSAFLE